LQAEIRCMATFWPLPSGSTGQRSDRVNVLFRFDPTLDVPLRAVQSGPLGHQADVQHLLRRLTITTPIRCAEEAATAQSRADGVWRDRVERRYWTSAWDHGRA